MVSISGTALVVTPSLMAGLDLPPSCISRCILIGYAVPMMVAHVLNNEMLADQYNGQAPYDDRSAVEMQIAAMKELATRHSDWIEIAYSPADARRIIHLNKLAIVLGVEV